MIVSIIIVIVCSAVIWYFSDKLESAAHAIGHHLTLPASVKGAVLYAIPSSFPEFMVAIISVTALRPPVFAIGVGTIAGSAVFNILVIPALSVLVAGAAMKAKGQPFKGITVTPHIFLRDGVFYLVVVLVFVGAAIWMKGLSKIVALVFLAGYVGYVFMLWLDTKKHRREQKEKEAEEEEEVEWSLAKGVVWMLVSMGIVGVACYFLAKYTVEISFALGLNAYVVAVVLTAAATSVPDTIISVIAAKKGGEAAEDSIINAFSSNIFDILICLSIPAFFVAGTAPIEPGESIVSLILLPVMTIVALVLIKTDSMLTRLEAWGLLVLYALFIVAAIFNAQILNLIGLG